MWNANIILENVYQFSKERKKKFCDVTLIAGIDGKEVYAHRVVLSAANDFFHTLFDSNFEENGKSDIRIANITGDILEKVIECCYTGRIEVNEDNIESLLAAASYFIFTHLEKKCDEYLAGKGILHEENCVGVWILAHRYRFEDIKLRASAFLNQYFLKVTKCADFYRLDENELMEILGMDKIAVKSEEDEFNALVGWVKFNPEERKIQFPRLVQVVRLVNLADSFFLRKVRAVCKEFECEDTFLRLRKLRSFHVEANIQSRERSPALPDLIVIGHNNSWPKIAKYSHSLDEWSSLPDLPICRFGCSAGLVDNKLYCFGGLDRLDRQTVMENKVSSVDLETLEVKDLSPMMTQRCFISVLADGMFIYAIGGSIRSSSFFSTFFERYDIRADEWAELAPMAVPRRSPLVANLLGNIYVLGGCISSKYSKSVEKYDRIKKRWTFIAPMTSIGCKDAGVSNGYLYTFSNTHRGIAIERYDPDANEWTQMNLQYMGPGILSLTKISIFNDWLFMIGKRGSEDIFERQYIRSSQVVNLSPLLVNLSDIKIDLAAIE